MKRNYFGLNPDAQAREFWLLIAIVATCSGWLLISQTRAEDEKAEKPKSKLAEAAEEALIATQAQNVFQQATVEDVYRWSRRLMEAEQQDGEGDAATKRHIIRMRRLYEKTDALFNRGARGGAANHFHATKFYFLEAESLLKPAAQ